MLKTLRDRRHPILERTMIIGTNAPAAEQAMPKRAAYQWFHHQHGHQVVEIPTDRHIHEGGVIDRNKMGVATRRAGLAAAAVASYLIVDAASARGSDPPSTRAPFRRIRTHSRGCDATRGCASGSARQPAPARRVEV